ncbi:MAG: hypothetical protein JXQ99_12040 [Hyphomicrobiaceae bacterium]
MVGMNFLNLDYLDQHIYRITSQDYAVSLFTEKKNVLTQLNKLKDKFEKFLLNLGVSLNGEQGEIAFKDAFVGQCWTLASFSEAMWGIYANDPEKRYLRLRSTPRKLLMALTEAHPCMPQDTCFIGKVKYMTEEALKEWSKNFDVTCMNVLGFANSLLLKRRAFQHEREVRLLYLGDQSSYDEGLYRYRVDPHQMITQIMADPNRKRKEWEADQKAIKSATGFEGDIKRSKIYDPPDWDSPVNPTSTMS